MRKALVIRGGEPTSKRAVRFPGLSLEAADYVM